MSPDSSLAAFLQVHMLLLCYQFMQQLAEIIKTNIKRLAITTFGTYYIYNSHFLRDAQERMHFYLQITLLGRERQ